MENFPNLTVFTYLAAGRFCGVNPNDSTETERITRISIEGGAKSK